MDRAEDLAAVVHRDSCRERHHTARAGKPNTGVKLDGGISWIWERVWGASMACEVSC